MSDVVTLARTARESLALGLNALQADPRVPPHLVELAAPIAQAMGALHRIESTGGAQLAQDAQAALTHVQAALGSLQAQPPTQEAVVAGDGGGRGGAGERPRAGPRGAAAGKPRRPLRRRRYPSRRRHPFAPAPQAYAPPRRRTRPPSRPTRPRSRPTPPPQQAYAPLSRRTRLRSRRTPHRRPSPAAAPPQQSGVRSAAARRPRAAAATPSRAARAAGSTRSAAELGAHSPSNFYKGLSGNDIVDHGGLFVSTYKLPQARARRCGCGCRCRAATSSRPTPSCAGAASRATAASDAPPGFGAQFTEITPEARQLVYRYARNREPMFHDDL